MEAQIISIGNELLIGKTLDSNSNWLAIELFKLGIKLRKISIIPDEYEDINKNIKRALLDNVDLILTTGGLGPSRDDITIESISRSINQDFILNTEAVEMVKKRYDELFKKGSVDFPELNESRRKMAKIPKNAIPIYNDIGAAPGMLIRIDKTFIFSMPGVPSEMKYIFNSGIKKIINSFDIKDKLYIEEHYFNEKDETILAPILEKVEVKIPGLTLKPLSEKFDKDTRLKVRFVLSEKLDCKEIIKQAINLINVELDKKNN